MPSTGYRTAMASTVGALGSAGVGASAIMVLVLASGPGIGSDAAFELSPAVVVVAGSVGATVGTALAIRFFGQDEADYRGIIPYPDIRREDAGPALVGAAVALLPGIGAALLLRRVTGQAGDPLVFLAVPVAQGIGAAISINRSRARGGVIPRR